MVKLASDVALIVQNIFRNLFSKPGPQAPLAAASTEGALIYAIGDIHGRLDLSVQLVRQICADVLTLKLTVQPILVFLGDYVDRGPESKGVIDQIIQLTAEPGFQVCALKGNHEAQMLAFMEDAREGPIWAEFGGATTLTSYGVKPPLSRSDREPWEEARLAFIDAVPPDHVEFLRGLELSASYGDYAFVHAGFRPGVPYAEQTERDLLWIREEFLGFKRSFDKVVVHGHTPEAAPHLGDNRIGVDTGAYATGVLTAVRLYDTDRAIIQTSRKLAATA